MQGVTAVSTARMGREEWLALRRKSIGGSDAAGIIGLSRWSSPYTVWADKTGRIPDKPDTEAMRIGRDLEDYVARRWCEATGKRCRRKNVILYNRLYPFAHADIDREVIGEDAGLECKTTSALNVRKFRDVEFPEEYYAQCVHYLAVTGFSRWYLAVLVFGRGFYVYTLERDQAEIEALMQAERTFWQYVKTDSPPPVDGGMPTTEAIQTIYAESSGQSIQLFGREAALREYQELRDRRGVLETRMREIENIVKLDMQDAETAACGEYTIRWRNTSRKTFQPRAFQHDHPELDLTPYYKTTEYRTFQIIQEGN